MRHFAQVNAKGKYLGQGEFMADPYYVRALKSGEVWANTGTGVTLDFMFWTATPSYYLPGDYEQDNFQAFDAGMQTATYTALAMVSSFCNITFNEVFIEGDAELGFATANLDPAAGAWAYYPDATDPVGGDVWMNNLYPESVDFTEGTYGFLALIHEIGHSLGLKHSFESPSLPAAEESSVYTVMSYTNPFYNQTYALYDIAALQSLYGANMTYNTGDDTYTIVDGETMCIWDAGGNDTWDGSGVSQGLTLNLNAGTISSMGTDRMLAIAFGVTIENAIGSAFSDTITGNNAGNVVDAGDGSDIIYMGSGGDTVDGGLGTDTVYINANWEDVVFAFVDPATCTSTSTQGADTYINVETFYFTNGFLSRAELEAGDQPHGAELTGGATKDVLVGAAYNDTLDGGDGNDVLSGMAGNDTLIGGTGKDKMTGGTGNDVYYVDTSGDATLETILPSGGIDTVHASINITLQTGIENLLLEGAAVRGTGNSLANTMIGNGLNNLMSGSSGNDILDGGDGNDTLTGGSGTDTFVYHTGDTGVDLIKDFKLDQGDRFDLSDIISAFDPLADAITDFVQVTRTGVFSQLSVDEDGLAGGVNFVQIASLYTGKQDLTNEDMLLANGHLITA
jgi:serralysin